MAPTLIRKERARLWRLGAMAAPEGLEAATPVVINVGAAAVPTGRGGSSSDCGLGEGSSRVTVRSSSTDWKRTDPGLLGSFSVCEALVFSGLAP